MKLRLEESHIEKEQSSDFIEEELWIEKIARITRCEQLGQKIFHREGFGPYLFQWIFQIILLFPLQIYVFIRYGWSFWLAAPMAAVLVAFGLTFAVWATKKLRTDYYGTIKILADANIISKNNFYRPIIPLCVKFAILFLGLSAILLRIVYVDIVPILQNPMIMGHPSAATIFSPGLINGISVSLIWIFVYMPLSSEFVSLIFGIHIFLPLKLKKYGIKLNYSDPHLFDGLKPIGNLFKKSTGIYFFGLTILLIATFDVKYRFGLASTAFFVGGWILGFVLFFAPQLAIHYSMKQAKQEGLESAEKRMREHGEDDEGFLFSRTIEDEEVALNYIYDYLEYNHADKLKVYPFDVSTIRDLMLTAIIPISAEVVIRLYFYFAGL